MLDSVRAARRAYSGLSRAGSGRATQEQTAHRPLSACAAALLGTWCIFGGWTTLAHLVSEDEGWHYQRPDSTAAVVGMPGWWNPSDIGTLRRILAAKDRTNGVPWLVLYPADTPKTSLQYIRAQLAYHEYPLRVDVSAVGSELPSPRYAGIITPPSVELQHAGEFQSTPEGFRIYAGLGQ